MTLNGKWVELGKEAVTEHCDIKVRQSRYRPGVAQRFPGIKVPRFHDNGTGWW